MDIARLRAVMPKPASDVKNKFKVLSVKCKEMYSIDFIIIFQKRAVGRVLPIKFRAGSTKDKAYNILRIG